MSPRIRIAQLARRTRVDGGSVPVLRELSSRSSGLVPGLSVAVLPRLAALCLAGDQHC